MPERTRGRITALVDKALMNARPGDYLLVQLEIPIPVVEYALTAAKKKGMITVLNPAPAAKLSEAVYADCDWLIPNQTEAEFLHGHLSLGRGQHPPLCREAEGARNPKRSDHARDGRFRLDRARGNDPHGGGACRGDRHDGGGETPMSGHL